MKNKSSKTSKEVLLNLLREKQKRIGFSYITTKHISYKIFRWLFFASLVYCTLINLFYILGKSGEMAANIAFMGDPEPHQEIEIARITTTIYIMIASAVALALSEVFVWLKLPVLQFTFSLIPSIVIVARLSGEIEDPTSYTLSTNHIVPLFITCFLSAVSAYLLFNQLRKDKKACNEINTIIYNTYRVSPDELPESEWDNVINAYEPRVSKKKKQSKRKARRKDKNVEIYYPPQEIDLSKVLIPSEEAEQSENSNQTQE
ncbi:MAG: hypothetical protein IJD71_01750 [Clostridia bacterium]|nr:hypothetical protein [Clostridia bacterium]